jgi:hypothetical protein
MIGFHDVDLTSFIWSLRTMKTKALKRQEAEVRAVMYKYKDSKAKRLGTATLDQWKSRPINN